ncbi:hypothetical protein, partial [Actibacterium sp. MT2.3-13A]|uniref:hypothetical protein n=1 Tax=Actibacterium sp. MT2.3-13A TaxID=2828332 RepID=UPI001BAC491A
MICSSVNLVRFIVRPQVGPDSNRWWRKNPVAGQVAQEAWRPDAIGDEAAEDARGGEWPAKETARRISSGSDALDEAGRNQLTARNWPANPAQRREGSQFLDVTSVRVSFFSAKNTLGWSCGRLASVSGEAGLERVPVVRERLAPRIFRGPE